MMTSFWRNLLFGILLAGAGALLAAGCGSPRQRYQTLRVFLDGVPDPDAVKSNTRASGDAQVPVMARVVKQHPPYRDNNCAVCHQSANGDIQDFSLAYNACVKCHKTIATEHAKMHGPVAREACKWCHTPHESAEPALLKADPVKVCTQCHDQQLLGAKPVEHLDGKTSCLNCHFGHGGDARYFLKSATQPATQATPDRAQARRNSGPWHGWLPVMRAAASGPPVGREHTP